MKNLSLLSNGKTKWMHAYIRWLALFFACALLVQIHPQPVKAQSKRYPITAIVKQQHRDNLDTLKKCLDTLLTKEDRGKVNAYLAALDKLMGIRSENPVNLGEHNKWLDKKKKAFDALDSTIQEKITKCINALPRPCLTLDDLARLGILDELCGQTSEDDDIEGGVPCCLVEDEFGMLFRCCHASCMCA